MTRVSAPARTAPSGRKAYPALAPEGRIVAPVPVGVAMGLVAAAAVKRRVSGHEGKGRSSSALEFAELPAVSPKGASSPLS